MNRKRPRPRWFEESRRIPDTVLYRKREASVSAIPDTEREFIWAWCRARHIDDVFPVLALTYWLRVRKRISVFFMLCDSNKNIYMVLCVHLALKWLGYDEVFKCSFFTDLVQIYSSMTVGKHQRMEMDLLEALDWEME